MRGSVLPAAPLTSIKMGIAIGIGLGVLAVEAGELERARQRRRVARPRVTAPPSGPNTCTRPVACSGQPGSPLVANPVQAPVIAAVTPVAHTGADELMITSQIFDHAARLRSAQLRCRRSMGRSSV